MEIIILSVFFLFIRSSFGAEYRITSTSDFTNFLSKVNSGSSYSGTTVFLDSDLSFFGYVEVNPIGFNNTFQFSGAFDGQGHVISNLNITGSSRYVGLFGYSKGSAIRNVILDFSCSITNAYIGSDDVYVGGINGRCVEGKIENSLNMASVKFNGNTSKNLKLGGIAGCLLSSSGYESTVKNCANYGSVTHSGAVYYDSFIGGIAGELYSGSRSHYIYNCINYGTITHNGRTSGRSGIGGIAGYAYYTYIENCVSAGMISSSVAAKYGNIIGTLMGEIFSEIYINHCYYTNGLSRYNVYGYGTPTCESNTLSYNNNTFELNEAVSIRNYTGHSLIDALNAASDYYILRGYSHWLLNKNKKTVSFTVNGRTIPINMNYQIILLPSLASEGYISFDGWYTNSGCTSPLTSYEVTTTDTSLYGKFEQNTNNYTITFDTRGGTPVSSMSVKFGTNISFPNNTLRNGCNTSYWENVHGDNVGFSLIMPAQDITLYAVWKCTHIEAPDDLLDFSKIVNSGTDYFSGSTVFLDSDLSLSGYTTMSQISTDSGRYFCGVFDGQGYVISNLNLSSSSHYSGLFGYSEGSTIRNVVLDSSCSVNNIYSGTSGRYLGGIIGYCEAYKGQCNIENNVNMANVTFSGSISGYYLYLGGIAGYLRSYSRYISIVKNCANYGSITHLGSREWYSYIGGIVGSFAGSYYKYTYNCLNYGEITHNGTTSSRIYLGGIAGYAEYTYIENCVSAGIISSPSKSTYIGSLAGSVGSETYSNYSYYTNDLGNYSIYGSGTPISESNTPNVSSDVNSTLISNLNDQATSDNGWNEWLLNLNNETITFKVNNNIVFSLSSQIILLPNPIVSNNSFIFSEWYTDPYYNDPFQSNEVSEGMILYSLYGVVVNVTFNATGGNVTVTSKSVSVNNPYGELPLPTKIGYTFVGWFINEDEKILNESKVTNANNHTLYAQWAINNYTVTFNFNNGTDPEVRVLDYNSTINYPVITEREGYTSNEWDREDIKFMPAKNITVTAQWIPNNYTVTYIFNNNNEKREEKIFSYNEAITYPNGGKKRGYNFAGWNQKHEFMPAYNFTTHEQWIPNNYTVVLDVNDGGELDEDEITVTFNSKYENLPIVKRTGYTFIGWLVINGIVEENIENEENIIVNNNDTVNITSNYTFVAQWDVNNYTVILKTLNGKDKKLSLNYGVSIEANVSSPSKPFYSFDRWCTEDGKICTPDGKVPAEDIILFPHFTLNIAAVSGTAVGIVAFPFLVLLLIVLIFIILMVKNGMKVGHEAADVEMTFVNKGSGEEDTRLIEQMETTKISKDLESKLMKHIKDVERNKPINEVLDNLGIDSSDNNYGISESFKVAGVSPTISNGIFSGTNLSAVSSYISLLYTTVREQEEFEEFKKLYLGMKEVDSFIDRKDDDEISFGGIISGFTDKKKVIRLLSENEEDNLPRGVLFKVQNGKGYNVGGQDEILFEMNSKFRIERVEEIIKRRYVVVKLSYASPNSDNEIFHLK